MQKTKYKYVINSSPRLYPISPMDSRQPNHSTHYIHHWPASVGFRSKAHWQRCIPPQKLIKYYLFAGKGSSSISITYWIRTWQLKLPSMQFPSFEFEWDEWVWITENSLASIIWVSAQRSSQRGSQLCHLRTTYTHFLMPEQHITQAIHNSRHVIMILMLCLHCLHIFSIFFNYWESPPGTVILQWHQKHIDHSEMYDVCLCIAGYSAPSHRGITLWRAVSEARCAHWMVSAESTKNILVRNVLYIRLLRAYQHTNMFSHPNWSPSPTNRIF